MGTITRAMTTGLARVLSLGTRKVEQNFMMKMDELNKHAVFLGSGLRGTRQRPGPIFLQN